MDTHVADPTLEDVQSYQARLPGEPGTDRQESSAEPLRAGERTATATTSSKNRRKSGLLSGVAIIAVVVIASGGFLVSPYNTFVPFPPALKLQVAQLLHGHFGTGQQRVALATPAPSPPPLAHPASPPAHTPPSVLPTPQQTAQSDVLAPSAALAAVKAPAAPAPVKQSPYVPTTPQDEVAELEGLAAPSPGQVTPAPTSAATPGTAAQPKLPATATQTPIKPVQVATQAEVVPPGYVPHEPGAAPQNAIVTPHPAVPQTAKPAPTSHPAVVVPVTANAEPTPTAQPQSAAAIVKPPSVATPTAALAAATKLEAAPMSPSDQIQVLELVTQLATLIRDERTQISNLQADEQNGNKATAAKLSDFERRLALVEANAAMTSAASVLPSSPAAPTVSPTVVALTSARAALKEASQPAPVHAPAPAAAPAPAPPATPEIYRVQAASPGLAMLAEVDHSGGDGAQIEVQVGDTIPGYGHVISVTQRGTNWVVKTDNGLIQ
ncbi:hypothetical protein ACELLULO517_22530 [Acidisoma cellulosilytica]|uniref:Uncharacterized protein n=1 Tax=Acidisoma cellulosilyticum TaxID=2802395 RepID=A0A963Z586_9PROT|nr:hypothetical protein [Acidisoma cellulosilyticum]MCB8883042.1 hypothetical protein [Acidisoma cellulosilyticum]